LGRSATESLRVNAAEATEIILSNVRVKGERRKVERKGAVIEMCRETIHQGDRFMVRSIRYLLPFFLLLLLSSPVGAHNFIADPGVNHWTEVKILDDQVIINYSTYLEEGAVTADLQVMDLDKDGKVSPEEEEMFKTMMLSNLKGFLSLTVDGQNVDLIGSIDFHSLRARRYRFVADLSALPPGEHRIAFYDGTFLALPGRLKTSLIASGRVQVLEWAIPEDRPLPQDSKEKAMALLAGRKNERTITVRYRTTAIVGAGGSSGQKGGKETVIASTLGGGSIRERLRDMINNPRWDIKSLVAPLLIAFVFGAAHALTPGHGKTIVAAYLVGTKGRVWDAILLGVIVTMTHTFSVFVLGLGMLYASQYVMPQTLFPWLTALSGVLVAGMGIWLFFRRLSSSPVHGHEHGHPHHHQHPHPHGHPHHNDHGHEHSHQHEAIGVHTHGSEILKTPSPSRASDVSLGSLFSLGISGGIVPCPEALVVLMIAFALNRITLGLVILVSFSVGLALVLVAIGVLLVVAKPMMTRFTGEGRIIGYLPVASAVVVTVLGCAIAYKGLVEAKIL
jgi:ABC-type nickel/cobalt efflux system permease component RcnA